MRAKVFPFLFLMFLILAMGQFARADEMETSGASFAMCRAETVCWTGRSISCWAYGSSFQNIACNWFVIPGQYVECRGFDDWGRWVVSWARCY